MRVRSPCESVLLLCHRIGWSCGRDFIVMDVRRRAGHSVHRVIPRCYSRIPFRTKGWTYYLRNRLIAVAYVDALPEALSATTATTIQPKGLVHWGRPTR
jgi:hypothetical protein